MDAAFGRVLANVLRATTLRAVAEEPRVARGVGLHRRRFSMSTIGARASDWHSGNPRVKPALWIAAFAGAFIFSVAVAALIGGLVNGDGSPFLS
jgi:hypothetical protein